MAISLANEPRAINKDNANGSRCRRRSWCIVQIVGDPQHSGRPRKNALNLVLALDSDNCVVQPVPAESPMGIDAGV